MSKRIKTRYVGVYYRFSSKRPSFNGKPDKCFDIHYKAGTKYIFEKIGWISEGYSVEDAIEMRGLRVRALRHPELQHKERTQPTLDMIWAVYREKRIPFLKRADKYISIYEKYIQPCFGQLAISDITVLDIESFKLELFNKKSYAGTHLQPGTVKEILKFFKSLITKANVWNITDSNYNPIGKIDISDSDPIRERYLTPEEATKLLDACQLWDCQMYYIVCISLYTGMRLGEIVSLRREQINLDAGVIALNSKTGRRTAYIPTLLKPIFEKLIPKNPPDLLFHNASNGQPLGGAAFSIRFARLVDSIGLNKDVSTPLNKVVFHTLRHTFCSWLAIQGVPLYTIGQLVGHKKPDMTQRYAKLSPDSKRDALEGIGAMLEETVFA